MPRPRKELDEFRAEIEHRVTQGQTHTQIRNWLATKGVRISKNMLSTRCVEWQASRRTRTTASDPALASAHQEHAPILVDDI
jgi:hypothetical protein